MEKDEMRQLMFTQKLSVLDKRRNLIGEFLDMYKENLNIKCDLMNDEIKIVYCLSPPKGRLWNAFTHLTTSLPFRDGYGRRVKIFVTCNDHILGMLCMRSPPGTNQLRDEYLGWTHEIKWKKDRAINSIYDIGVCVSTRMYANHLTGKLLVYAAFSDEVATFLEKRYSGKETNLDGNFDDGVVKDSEEKLLGYMTTSLYGKSSIYNRIPFLKYLGLSKGFSGVYLTEQQWIEVRRDFLEKIASRRGDKAKKVFKYQMLAELNRRAEQKGKKYKYASRNDAWRRGVYFGHLKDARKPLDEMVADWRTRWLENRLKKIKHNHKKAKVEELNRINELLDALDKNTSHDDGLQPLF